LPLEGHAFMVSFYEFLVWKLRKKSNIKQNVIVVIPELVESVYTETLFITDDNKEMILLNISLVPLYPAFIYSDIVMA